jgi:hypothetical protein
VTVETRVPAVGGTRTVPEPDPIASDYLLLGLRLDQHLPGLIDAYYGPASLKAQVELEPKRSPAALRDDAASLQARVAEEIDAPDRRTWLTAQLAALEAQAAVLAGDTVPYEDLVAKTFDFEPRRVPETVLDAAAARIDELLTGPGDLATHLEAWDATVEIPVDRLPAALDWLVDRFRARAAELFGLPNGERLRIGLVRNQPWSAYAWYDGGLHSRIDINTDLPSRVPDLAHTVAHEAYPGHHLEHAWKDADLVEERRRVESSILLINTPECLISEGLADLGVEFAFPAHERPGVLEELFELAGLALAADPVRRRETAELAAALVEPRATLWASKVNAALMLHVDGAPREEVLEYLVRAGRYSRADAEKRLEFLVHPLWRTYTFVYSEGETLLRRWVHAVPEADRPARFARLLHEQLTPGMIRSDLQD